MKKILVFTDLDGTLLNHYNYSWDDALPALNALNEKSYPVIISSSKTSAEILQLKQKMSNSYPYISENGAIGYIPDNYFTTEHTYNGSVNYHPTFFAKPYQEIIRILDKLRDNYQFSFRGFHDMAIDELVALTDLSEEQAMYATQREASEPFLWKDSDSAFDEFKQHLAKENLTVTSGGRFYHVMSDVNKGQTIQWLINKYQVAEPETQWITIGLGDSYNDIQMLEAVDYPVFVNNPGTKQPDLSNLNNLLKTRLPGPAGWNKAILKLMIEII